MRVIIRIVGARSTGPSGQQARGALYPSAPVASSLCASAGPAWPRELNAIGKWTIIVAVVTASVGSTRARSRGRQATTVFGRVAEIT